jgi:hypothetical protein
LQVRVVWQTPLVHWSLAVHAAPVAPLATQALALLQ